jgi:tetratricopeptide (TPR) repeat protein
MMARIFLGLFFVLSAFGAHSLHLNQVRLLPANKDQFDTLYLPDPAFLQFSSLGNETLMADLLWLQTIQYYGDRVSKSKVSPFLYRYFDAITSLDPDFISAYLFAGYVMGDEPDLRDDAVKILHKGMRLNPENWQLPYQLAMFYHLYFKDAQKAAETFELVSRIPQAPAIAKSLAAQLYRKADTLGSCMVSLRLWSQNLAQTSEKHLREKTERHFIETSIFCDLIRIRQAIESYRKRKISAPTPTPAPTALQRRSRLRRVVPKPTPVPVPVTLYPANLSELVKLGLLAEEPKDFFKRPYLYDPSTGSVKVQPLPWPVYDVELKAFIVSEKR